VGIEMCTPLSAFFAPVSTRYATAFARIRPPLASILGNAVAASYLAAMGQTGMQLLLPQQGGRPSYATRLLRAGAEGRFLSPIRAAAPVKRCSPGPKGRGPIGWGLERIGGH